MCTQFCNDYSAQVWYKLPYADDYTYIAKKKCDPICPQDICGEGFVIAPFIYTKQTPCYIVRPDILEHYNIPQSVETTGADYATDEEDRKVLYGKSFDGCYQALRSGIVKKIVLSRRLQVTRKDGMAWDALQLFLRACQLYPDRYIALWTTPLSGTWLVATPEVLLEKCMGFWKTMALAGTMTWEAGKREGKHASWSAKDRQEQQLVQQYIHEKLLPHAEHIEIVGPFPTKVGDLAHLRSDISFTLHQSADIGDVLNALHPTPAVCGLPTDEAFRVIDRYEDAARRYYAGYSGPVGIDDETRLYVSLRCMELSKEKAMLYAGGGLLRDSVEEHEWIETCRKLNTMLQLLNKE